GLTIGFSDFEIEPIEMFPHLLADLLPHTASIFARHGDAPDYGIGVGLIPEHKIADTTRRVSRIMLFVERFVSGGCNHWLPASFGFYLAGVEQGMEVDCQQPHQVFCPLDIPRYPVERICHA